MVFRCSFKVCRKWARNTGRFLKSDDIVRENGKILLPLVDTFHFSWSFMSIVIVWIERFVGHGNVLEYLLSYDGKNAISCCSISLGVAWIRYCHHHHYHHHVPEGLGAFPVPWSSRWSWSLHLFFGRSMFLRPFGLYCSACFGSLCPSSVHVVATFGLYCSACFGSLSVSILCTCCSHFRFIL